MPLTAATLKSGLEALEPTDDPMAAANKIADAFDAYFKENVAGPIPGTGDVGAKATMLGSLSGLDAPSGAAAIIAAGITAYWGVVAGAAAAVWIAVPPAISAVPPAGLAGLAPALIASFVANTSGELSLADSAGAMADAIHGTQSGGMVIFPPPAPPPPGLGPQPIT